MDGRHVIHEVLVGGGSRWVIDSTPRARTVATGRARTSRGSKTRAEKTITLSPIEDCSVRAGTGDMVFRATRR